MRRGNLCGFWCVRVRALSPSGVLECHSIMALRHVVPIDDFRAKNALKPALRSQALPRALLSARLPRTALPRQRHCYGTSSLRILPAAPSPRESPASYAGRLGRKGAAMAGRKGAIAFGLVYIPVELYRRHAGRRRAVQPAGEGQHAARALREDVPRLQPRAGPPTTSCSGYQYEKGKYVVVSDEELDAIKSDADRCHEDRPVRGPARGTARLLREALPGKAPSPAARRALELLRLAMLAERARPPSAPRCWATPRRPSPSCPTATTWS